MAVLDLATIMTPLKKKICKYICDRLCENVPFRAKNQKEIRPKKVRKYLLIDFLIINSPLTLDIALSIRQVSAHFTCFFIPGEHSESFTFLVGFSDLYLNIRIVRRVCRKLNYGIAK